MILAQNTLDRIAEYWKHGDRTPSILILGGALLAIILLSVIAHYIFPALKDRQKKIHLFRVLSELNQLSPQEYRVLERAARLANLEDPALIFVRRSAFDELAPSLAPPHVLDGIRRKVYQ